MTRLSAELGKVIGPIDDRLFGTFVEHLGRCVYTGIWEPDHPTADAHGFRTDVLHLARELGVTIIRYPGGNFVSGYCWEDGVGPGERRPRRLELAWRSIEPNKVGTDDFVSWVRRVGAEPLLAVNLGTRGVDAARALVEYCNHRGGTTLSEQRIANGFPEPHAVPVWCLGNEMDAPWQLGQKSAHDYGLLAREAAKAMKLVDPTIELVACGSSSSTMPTFGEWERLVLEHCYEYVDYISLHAYYEEQEGDLDSFLASGEDMERFIETVVAISDEVAQGIGSDKRVDLAFDEWNVWYLSQLHEPPIEPWQERPRIAEDVYTLADAIVVGSMLITLLRHADRVRIACLAQLVNALAPIMTEPGSGAWRQTTFFPFALTSRYAKGGTALRLEIQSRRIETAKYGAVAAIDAVAVGGENDDLTVICVNRSSSERFSFELAAPKLNAVTHVALTGHDPYATNTRERPDAISPRTVPETSVAGGRLLAEIPPLSWNLIRLTRS